jgi:hypothetical protein
MFQFQIFVKVLNPEKIWDVYYATSAIEPRIGGMWISNDLFMLIGYMSEIDDSTKFNGLVNEYMQILVCNVG